MHPFFSVTLFTGQQLVLEALQRWLVRPCPDAAAHARRRLGLKQLIALLLRTAATGVLATVLDAAIEFRRRQLLAVAAADPEWIDGESPHGASRFPGLGMLSRAGVAAWKSRLLLAIDELERRAGAYGIESRHRFSPGKADTLPATASSGEAAEGVKALARHPRSTSSCTDLAGRGGGGEAEAEERSRHLGRTVEQLRELVKQGDAESQRQLDAEVGSLVDLILGTTSPPPSSSTSSPASQAAARSRSVPAALDSLRVASPSGAAAAGRGAGGSASVPASPCSSGACGSGGTAELCAICMDRPVTVQVAGCSHEVCFGCARRLCATHDHLVPQCPFCRQAIEGFVAIGCGGCHSGSAIAAPAATVARV